MKLDKQAQKEIKTAVDKELKKINLGAEAVTQNERLRKSVDKQISDLKKHVDKEDRHLNDGLNELTNANLRDINKLRDVVTKLEARVAKLEKR
ncbi:MAG: hypothetical protein AAF393_04775 [Pseudomonadota bacterium]